MISIKDLFFSYGKLKVFQKFSLDVPEGEVCLITGINGVGKSTLLRLIAKVLRPAGGEIIFDKKLGQDPRHKIGFISDILSLYDSLTVAQPSISTSQSTIYPGSMTLLSVTQRLVSIRKSKSCPQDRRRFFT